MRLELGKYSGAKNVFLIGEKKNLPTALSVEKVQKMTPLICDPYEGFFADGVVLLEQQGESDFKWHFYNSDGSSAEMCGNAVRCVHAYLRKSISEKLETISIQTLAGKINSRYAGGKYHVKMSTPSKLSTLQLNENFFSSFESFQIFLKTASPEAIFVDTGVPHLVINVNDWNKALSLSSIWYFIRSHGHFSKGTNVTLIQSRNDSTARAISFERGVDKFTQACGTGAVAAALVIGKKEKRTLVNVEMPGGNLTVDLNNESPVLIGSAQEVGAISLEIKE